jgi:hypothetical protein
MLYPSTSAHLARARERLPLALISCQRSTNRYLEVEKAEAVLAATRSRTEARGGWLASLRTVSYGRSAPGV